MTAAPLVALAPILAGGPPAVNPCGTARCHQGTCTISAVLVRLLISDVHWLARTERVSLRATPQLGYGLILVCAAAAKCSFEASFFDYVRVQDELIIERVQQAGVLGQMRQLYGKALGLVGLDAMFLRL
jgi:hypothetical protein